MRPLDDSNMYKMQRQNLLNHRRHYSQVTVFRLLHSPKWPSPLSPNYLQLLVHALLFFFFLNKWTHQNQYHVIKIASN